MERDFSKGEIKVPRSSHALRHEMRSLENNISIAYRSQFQRFFEIVISFLYSKSG
jgi:hypothetical protein